MKIKATTPMGIYLSKEVLVEVDSEGYLELKKLLQDACDDRGSFSFKKEKGGEVFFTKEMIQKSVFELVY